MFRLFLFFSLMISSVANAVEVSFKEFDHKEERWFFKKINTEDSKVLPALENNDVALLGIEAGAIHFINSDEGIYKSSNEANGISPVIHSDTLEAIYSRDFIGMSSSDKPYVSYGDGMLALSAYVDKSNVINIYEIVSPDEIKIVYKGQQKGLYYPIKFGVNNDVFFLNKNIIYKINLSSKQNQQEYFFKPPSCHRVLDYNFSDDYQVISYACIDEKSNSNSIFLYSRETKVLEKICNDCREVEHDLSDDGMKLLYVRHNESSSVLNEFYFKTLRNKVLYETENWLVTPLYLN